MLHAVNKSTTQLEVIWAKLT